MQGMTFNRFGLEVVNWNYVESVNFEDDVLIINYASGSYKKITDPTTIENLMDMFSVFPDINDDEVRRAIKLASAQSSPVKTERTSISADGKKGPKRDTIKTDIIP